MIDWRRLTDWDYLTLELQHRAGIILNPKEMGRCFMCGRETGWIDIAYEGYLCSPLCSYEAAEDAAQCSQWRADANRK